jgi:hypothetical protein
MAIASHSFYDCYYALLKDDDLNNEIGAEILAGCKDCGKISIDLD